MKNGKAIALGFYGLGLAFSYGAKFHALSTGNTANVQAAEQAIKTGHAKIKRVLQG